MKNSNSIDMASFILQMLSLDLLFKDFNNSDLMDELRQQDEKYLKTIINQNEKILNILKERGDESGR